jgi:CubicO group peptidase (beta-lactamase class C family)
VKTVHLATWFGFLLCTSLAQAEGEGACIHTALIASHANTASTGSESARPIDVAELDHALAKIVAERGIVGASVALVDHGKVVLAKGYGRTALTAGVPVTPETMFQVGSVTKQFASACILLLAQDGKLSVEDKVAKFFPNLTDAQNITLLDLMSHQSGYPDYYPLDFVDARLLKPASADEIISRYAGGRLDFPPRTRYSYSNTGFIILGRVVERVSGRSFGEFLKRRILDPLGMTHSVLDPEPGAAGLARGHISFSLAPLEATTQEVKSWLYAAGGLASTPSDLVRWNLAILEGRVLKPEFYKIMTTPRPLADGRMTRYGCGVAINTRPDGELTLSHSGAVSGFLAENIVLPRTKSSVVVLINSEEPGAMSALRSKLLSALLPEYAEVPRVSGPPALEVSKEMFRSLQSGQVDRSRLGEEFGQYLTAERLTGAAAALKALGEPTEVTLGNLAERGGMEVSRVVFRFPAASVSSSMFRSVDGKIQQFLLSRQ